MLNTNFKSYLYRLTLLIIIYTSSAKANSTKKMFYILSSPSQREVNGNTLPQGQELFIKKECMFRNCFITYQKSFFTNVTQFDAILFNAKDIHRYRLPPKFDRSAHQQYIFASRKPLWNFPIDPRLFDDYFNITWTYRLDSNISFGYIVVRNLRGKIIGPKRHMHWIDINKMLPITRKTRRKLRNKSRIAAWFVSKCSTNSKREFYVNKMQQELRKYGEQVDIFGPCGNMRCWTYDTGIESCNDLIKARYYFYLAFESSLSEDYVTKKILTALQNYAIPIVYGGANYTRFLPNGIYLDALALGPENLVIEMTNIIRNKSRYYDFFKWRNHYSFHDALEHRITDGYCKLCAALNNERKRNQLTSYKNFSQWWQSSMPLNFVPYEFISDDNLTKAENHSQSTTNARTSTDKTTQTQTTYPGKTTRANETTIALETSQTQVITKALKTNQTSPITQSSTPTTRKAQIKANAQKPQTTRIAKTTQAVPTNQTSRSTRTEKTQAPRTFRVENNTQSTKTSRNSQTTSTIKTTPNTQTTQNSENFRVPQTTKTITLNIAWLKSNSHSMLNDINRKKVSQNAVSSTDATFRPSGDSFNIPRSTAYDLGIYDEIYQSTYISTDNDNYASDETATPNIKDNPSLQNAWTSEDFVLRTNPLVFLLNSAPKKVEFDRTIASSTHTTPRKNASVVIKNTKAIETTKISQKGIHKIPKFPKLRFVVSKRAKLGNDTLINLFNIPLKNKKAVDDYEAINITESNELNFSNTLEPSEPKRNTSYFYDNVDPVRTIKIQRQKIKVLYTTPKHHLSRILNKINLFGPNSKIDDETTILGSTSSEEKSSVRMVRFIQRVNRNNKSLPLEQNNNSSNFQSHHKADNTSLSRKNRDTLHAGHFPTPRQIRLKILNTSSVNNNLYNLYNVKEQETVQNAIAEDFDPNFGSEYIYFTPKITLLYVTPVQDYEMAEPRPILDEADSDQSVIHEIIDTKPPPLNDAVHFLSKEDSDKHMRQVAQGKAAKEVNTENYIRQFLTDVFLRLKNNGHIKSRFFRRWFSHKVELPADYIKDNNTNSTYIAPK